MYQHSRGNDFKQSCDRACMMSRVFKDAGSSAYVPGKDSYVRLLCTRTLRLRMYHLSDKIDVSGDNLIQFSIRKHVSEDLYVSLVRHGTNG